MKNTRCEEVIVQLVVRTYDDHGRPICEQVSQPTKVFRNAETQDFWGHINQAVKALSAPQPPSTKKGVKR